MIIALFVVFSAMMFDQLLTQTLTNLRSQVDINVYFMPDAPEEEVDRIRTAVAALPEVVSVNYKTREEVLEEYRIRNQGDTTALQALDELNDNPLGATIAVQAAETSQYQNIALFLEEQKAQEDATVPVIDKVNYDDNQQAIDTLTGFIDVTERVSYIVTLVLLSAAILITFNTVRLGIYTSREEIAIMRLVGASNMFIRGPFMMQGVMYGFLAGIITLAIYYPILIWLGPGSELLFGLNLFDYYMDNFKMIFGVIVGIGIVLGLVSSTFAVARHLRT